MTLRSLSSRQSAALEDCSRTIMPPTARVGRRNWESRSNASRSSKASASTSTVPSRSASMGREASTEVGKAVLHGMLQLRRAIRSAEAGVFLNDQHAHANSSEAAHSLGPEGTAVSEGLDGTNAAAQSGEVKELSLQRRRREFKQNGALFFIPVIREEAGVFLQSRDARCEAGSCIGWFGGGLGAQRCCQSQRPMLPKRAFFS